MGERIELAKEGEPWASLFDPPQRVERGRGEKHRENDEIHDPREILQLLDERREQHTQRAQHETRNDKRWKHGQVAPERRWLNLPEIGDGKKRIDLDNGYGGARRKFGRQQK